MSRPFGSGNLFADVHAHLADEQILDLVAAPGIRITRIVSTGHVTDWQTSDEDEWVLVLQGSGTLRFAGNDRMLVLGPGEWCHIPAGARHRVEETDPHQPTVWLAVHFPDGEA
ncbi:cupin domain-containing protein [Emcibacter sp. SYSU 3D8]|uniref:cupin domain-containing protein n=1 Tax=Emcibacter sp. SYSU 3D8 TaxID=3133969 RepID=UPI0031FF3CBD